LPAYLIGVRCSLEVLEQRERERRDRTLGQARAQFERVHAHGLYDFEVDTSTDSLADCTSQIATYLRSGAEPFALRQLQVLYS
jgi:chloramphenicol 3-O phosphotransferase